VRLGEDLEQRVTSAQLRDVRAVQFLPTDVVPLPVPFEYPMQPLLKVHPHALRFAQVRRASEDRNE
jgi:hypothetical protein